jgi:hypothetical protein
MKKFLLLFLVFPVSSFADSIQFNDIYLEHVYIVEGKTNYYVNDPVDGSTTQVRKSDAEAVTYSSDVTERAQFKQQWREARGIDSKPKELKALKEYLAAHPKSEYTIIKAKGTRKASPAQTALARANMLNSKQEAQRRQTIDPLRAAQARLPLPRNNEESSVANNGGGNGGANFANISELFSTIDDRTVGEFPNPIALAAQGGQGAQGGLGALTAQP